MLTAADYAEYQADLARRAACATPNRTGWMAHIPGKLEYWETKTLGTEVVSVARDKEGFGTVHQLGWLWV